MTNPVPFIVSFRLNKRKKFMIDSKCHPQTISVIKTRAEGLGIEAIVVDRDEADFSNEDISGIIIQYPDTTGNIYNFHSLIHHAHQHKVGSLTHLMLFSSVTVMFISYAPSSYSYFWSRVYVCLASYRKLEDRKLYKKLEVIQL